MGTASIQISENYNSANRSIWTIQCLANDVVASDSTFKLPTFNTQAGYYYPGKDRALAYYYLRIYRGSSFLGQIGINYNNGPLTGNYHYWSSGPMLTLNKASDSASGATQYTSNYFNSSNPTSRTVALTATGFYWYLASTNSSNSLWNMINDTSGAEQALSGTVCTVTLDAPPTFTASQVSSNRNGFYTEVSTASVTLSSISAKYGGYITSAVLSIGKQTAELTGSSSSALTSGTLSIPLNAAGTFTPTVKVTDSRGQVTTVELDPITVLPYVCAASDLVPKRIATASPYKPDDEGTNVCLKATFKHSHFTGSTLSAPVVSVETTNISSKTIWYTNYDPSTGTFSGKVTSWTTLAAEVTLYARITHTFAKDSSYSLSVQPKTSLKSNAAVLKTRVAQSFYLLAGRPGGHGLGVGIKPSTDDLHLGMDAIFHESLYLDIDEDDASGVDYELITALKAIGWIDNNNNWVD